MKEEIFHNNDFYEKYVLGDLSEEEETRFEEHLLMCSYCKEQLENMEAIIYGVRQQPEKKPVQLRIYLAIAASLVILLTAGILLFDISFSTRPNGVGINSDTTDTATTVNEKFAEVRNNVVDEEDTTERVPVDIALSESFQPLAVY